jgi:hypothetical protein
MGFACLLSRMNLLQLSINQLKRAAAIKEQIEDLNKELRGIFAGPGKSAVAPKKTRTMSAAAKRNIAAAQRARWAKLRSRPSPAPAVKAKKKTMSPAAKAKLSAKLKAYWAAKKAGKK